MKEETLGARIRRVRNERGLSQRRLSRLLNGIASEGYLSRIESGEREPSVKVLREIAKALDVNPVYLETGSLIICPHCLRPFGKTDNIYYHQGEQ